MDREQYRQEGIDRIRTAIEEWASERDVAIHSNETVAPFSDLAARLFDLVPAYCPYDCGRCHDDEVCPCSNCTPEPCCGDHADGCQAPAYPCCGGCPDQGD